MTPTATDATAAAAAPAAVDVAPALGLSIARLARLLRQQDDNELSPTLGAALWTIAKGPLTLGDLAVRERVAPPTVTKIVEKLHRRGLVERRTDETDRRVCWVAVTAAGRDQIEASRRRRTAWFTERLERLAPQELARLSAAVEVLEALTAAPDPAPEAT